jgi:iron complex transport system substrate-binding protein
MTPNTLRTFLAAFLVAFSTQSAAQLTMRDDLGRGLILKSAAKRIVTLSPSLTELVYAAGAGDLVVGVDGLSDYPPEAKKVTAVGTGAKFSVDQLAALKPDFVLAWKEGIRREDVEKITAFGATVYVAQARTLSDIPRLLEAVGRATGRDTTPMVADFEARLEKVKRANQGKARMTVFLEIWNRPLTTISGSHFLSEALEMCRAENVFRELTGAAPKVTWEQVAQEDPFVIIGAGSASSNEEFRANWGIRSALSAVKSGRLIYLESDTIQRPTPRTPEGIAELCSILDKVRGGGGVPPPVIRTERPAPASPIDIQSPFSNPLPAIAAPGRPSAPVVPVPEPVAEAPPPRAPAVSSTPAAPPGTNPPAQAPTQAPPPTAAASQPPRPTQFGM